MKIRKCYYVGHGRRCENNERNLLVTEEQDKKYVVCAKCAEKTGAFEDNSVAIIQTSVNAEFME